MTKRIAIRRIVAIGVVCLAAGCSGSGGDAQARIGPAPSLIAAATEAPTGSPLAATETIAAPEATELPSATIPPTAPPTDTQAPTPDWAAKSAQVDAILAKYTDGNKPGAAVLVAIDGQIRHLAGYGLADLSNRVPITANTAFHLGSIGKPFTAVAVLMLVQDGLIGLDDPVGGYLPELAHFGDGVTIRRLLDHTSGLPDAYSGSLVNALTARASRPTNVDLLAILSEASLRFTPGEKALYNNTDYDVLGALIEAVSGERYADFLAERIFTPLGMNDSFALPSDRQKGDPNVAHGYSKYQGVIQPYDVHAWDAIVGSGAVYASAADMFRFDQALTAGRLFAPEFLAEAFRPGVLNDGTETPYGLGFELTTIDDEAAIGHGGKWLGYQGDYERIAARGLTVVVLMNWNYGPPAEDLEAAILKIYLS